MKLIHSGLSPYGFALVAMVLLGRADSGYGQTAVPPRDNYYAAAETVNVPAVVAGDVVAAGRTITMTNVIEGDVLAAGWRVTLSGEARDDVRLAGRYIVVNAPIAGDLTVAGADVSVNRDTHVAGRTWLTGATLDVNGVFDREVRLAGGTVRLGGEFRQPVHVVAEKLELLPTARVMAPLSYESPQPATIAATAVLAGATSYRPISRREAENAHAFRVVSSLFFATHLLLAGLLLLWLMPVTTARFVDTMRAVPGRSALLGLLLVFAVPVAALLLIVTLIGAPIGFSMAALYAVALLVGLVTTALRIGEWEARFFRWSDLDSRRQRAMMLVVGVLTLAVLRIVPVLGTLVVFFGVVCGLGALALSAIGSSKTGTAVPA